jgi:Ca2+-binding EF-hand superfamily protein
MEISLQSQLSKVFEAYCGSQSGTMDGKSFAKFAKDSHLIDKSLTQADVDLIFAKVKVTKSERRISFEEFFHSLELMSSKKGIDFN